MSMGKIDIIQEAKKRNLKVEWCDWVISARVENTLFVNPNLPKHEKFCREVLEHEYRHSGTFTKKDLWMDMVDGSLIETTKFCMMYPKALARFVPVSYYNREVHVDVNTIIIYVMITCLILALWILGVISSPHY